MSPALTGYTLPLGYPGGRDEGSERERGRKRAREVFGEGGRGGGREEREREREREREIPKANLTPQSSTNSRTGLKILSPHTHSCSNKKYAEYHLTMNTVQCICCATKDVQHRHTIHESQPVETDQFQSPSIL